jgi:hypothetical protein
MTTIYTKSLSTDFGGNLNTTQFHAEIVNDLTINKTLIGVNNLDDVVDIVFSSALDSGELTALNLLITNHVPLNVYSTTHYGALSADPIIENPQAGDEYYNTTINHKMCYDANRGKWLSVTVLMDGAGRNGTTGAGTYYRRWNGMVLAASQGPHVPKGTITRIGYSTSIAVNHTYQVLINGIVVAELSSGGSASAFGSFNVDFDAGIMSSRNKSGSATTTNLQSTIYYKLRA